MIPRSVCHLDQDYPNCHPRLRGLLSVSHDTARVSIGETCPHSGPIGPTLWYAPAPLLLCVCAVGYSARWVPVGREARVPPGASRRATSVAMSLAASGGSRFSAAGDRHYAVRRSSSSCLSGATLGFGTSTIRDRSDPWFGVDPILGSGSIRSLVRHAPVHSARAAALRNRRQSFAWLSTHPASSARPSRLPPCSSGTQYKFFIGWEVAV